MNYSSSPFSLNRFEYESRPLFYLPQPLFSELESQQPAYIIGSRGTGKTTLLKALHWEERITNDQLSNSLNNEPFSKFFIGVYLKLSETDLHFFENWLSKESREGLKISLISIYLDLMWIELILTSIAELITKEIIIIPTKLEDLYISKILNNFPTLNPSKNSISSNTIINLYDEIKKLRSLLFKYAKYQWNPEEADQHLPNCPTGEIGRSISNNLKQMIDESYIETNASWHFKICFDEAECLSHFQQIVLNSIIRISSGSAIFVVAYVSKRDDFNQTSNPGHTLQRADRRIIYLENKNHLNYTDLCKGVTTVRVQSYLSKNDVSFDPIKIFGKLNINKLLHHIINHSESAKAKQFLNDAINLSNLSSYYAPPINDIYNETIYPIYQAYIINKLNLTLPSKGDQWNNRAQESREIRKRMVAAYICICNELKSEILYAFNEMIFQISDQCIRDYLLQLDQLFNLSKLTLIDFLEYTNLDINIQNKAIKKASYEKWESLPWSEVSYPGEINRLVEGLAKITSLIQGDINKHSLKSSEKGIFVININKLKKDQYFLLDLIKEANDAGFLKILNIDNKKCEFRVHNSLSPAFKFSYRGAYYKSVISAYDVLEFVQTTSTDDFKQKLKQTVNNILHLDKTLPLFEESLNDNI